MALFQSTDGYGDGMYGRGIYGTWEDRPEIEYNATDPYGEGGYGDGIYGTGYGIDTQPLVVDIAALASEPSVIAVFNRTVGPDVTITATRNPTPQIKIPVISGVVMLDDQPAEDTEVLVINSTAGEVVGKVVTDANGEYSIGTESDIEHHAIAQFETEDTRYSDFSKPFVVTE